MKFFWFMFFVVLIFSVTNISVADENNIHVMAKGKILKLDSTTTVADTFSLLVHGTEGHVCNEQTITISSSNFPNSESFKRTYALALTAFSSGSTVELYNNPISASCPYINRIQMLKE